MAKYTIQCVSKGVDLPLPLINENCYVYNIFTTNHEWLVVIRFNLNLSLKLIFYSTNNNMSFRICCQNAMNIAFLLINNNNNNLYYYLRGFPYLGSSILISKIPLNLPICKA